MMARQSVSPEPQIQAARLGWARRRSSPDSVLAEHYERVHTVIRCVRLFTGADEQSHVQIGHIDLARGRNDDLVSSAIASTRVTVEETASGGALAWHTAPVRQLVVTLTGTLLFITRDGEEFTLAPGDVLLAEDTTGSGHQWKLVGDDPWRRIYIVLAEGADVPFIAD